jgi:hypothetical protein
MVWCWLLATLGAQPRPNPSLAPAEVIRTVVEALQNRNSPSPNAGIFTVYQFASPGNRVNTGPYGNFLQLVKLPPFVPLFSGHADGYGPLSIAGDHAEQAVRFRVEGNGVVWFRFAVSRQTSEQTRGRCTGCWMVDGVAPVTHEP